MPTVPLSTQQIADLAGISRQTAQRYLKLLDRTGRVTLALRYGETGRPEHRYAWRPSDRPSDRPSHGSDRPNGSDRPDGT
ncbi:hypothetical protein GCM10020254_25240 [Streptomyces goshikiensis]